MHILFDDAGKLMTGRLMSEAESSLQVELDSGKRVKVKTANTLLRFEKPAPAELMPAATALAESMELELAYEFAPEDDFAFVDLAHEYFSDQATTTEQVAALICLQGAPHYFRRAGKGRYKKAAPEIVAQALAAIEKKKQVQAQIEAWAAELVAGECPAPIREQLYKILFKPDKNAAEYKAVVEASRNSHTAPLVLLEKAGAINNAYQFHWQRFLFDQFPRGTGFPGLDAPAITEELPLADVQAFSIDDSQTTEIDDALSLQGLGSGTVTLGIHIAAPGLAIAPESAIDQVARERLSTVYMPGHKITMLPDDVVQRYTLMAGRDCPAVSLYVTFDEASLNVTGSRTALERVPIAHNLRHDQLDSVITEAWLDGEAVAAEVPSEIAGLQPSLVFLWRLARHLKAQREIVRGKPETFNRPDYNFRLEDVKGDAPEGTETVVITTRQRGAPLDLMVAEAMILANSTWGQWLAACGVPGIYRSQASLAPGVKVRMGTKAQPHAGIGVPAYAWSTSPLRRYVDLVNQWQIIACARHGATAALAAPFKPKDANLFAVISAFDAAYTAYNGFQNGMERYWTLKHLEQAGITELTATLFKDNLVRADTLPLVLPVMGAEGLARGARVRVRLGEVDEITLDISGTVIERLDPPTDSPIPIGEPEEDAEDAGISSPLALAIDVDEATGEETPAPANAG
ncbi:MAG TPA: RNB domain-containing ribonuclease [Hydrogenophaga sp.]